MMTTKSRVRKWSQTHRHNWYTECCHGCKQHRSRRGLKSLREIPWEFYIEQYRTTNSAKSFWKNEQLQWIIALIIRCIEQIFTWNFESHECHQGICCRKFEPFKTIHASKICRNVVEVLFRSRIRRKARNFVEFCRQVFVLLLYNTVYPLSWIELKTSMWQTNFKSQFFFYRSAISKDLMEWIFLNVKRLAVK